MTIRRTGATLTSLLTILLAAGCAKETDNRPQELREVQGHWDSNCVPGRYYALTSRSAIGITQRSSITIDGESVTEVARISSSACDGNDIEITSSGPFTLGSGAASKVMNVKVTSYRMKPVSEFGVRVLNLAKWCGFSDWALNQEKDVTAHAGKDKCVPSQTIAIPYTVNAGTMYIEGKDDLLSSSEQPADAKKNFYFTRL